MFHQLRCLNVLRLELLRSSRFESARAQRAAREALSELPPAK